MSKIEKLSYYIIAFTIFLVGSSGLGTPFITILFSYLALKQLSKYIKIKWLTITIFAVSVVAILIGFGNSLKQTIKILPGIINTALPATIEYTKKYDLEYILPFDDIDGFKRILTDHISGELGLLANYAKIATKEFVLLIIGLVIACAIFAKGELDLDKDVHKIKNNLYSFLSSFLTERFRTFYQSFATVMGAQLIISIINTSATAIFVIISGVPHATIVILVTFLCGMLPIIGNIISNTIIFLIAATVSIKLAVSALIYLIVIHKFEYFLNSKIIGEKIRNPMWLTLIGLVVGEKLMGIPGMILAPVLLNYFKVEAAKIEINERK